MTHAIVGSLCAALVLAAAGCDECDPEASRCRGTAAELCNGSGEWVEIMDCAAIEGGAEAWACCALPDAGTHGCLPASECPGGEP